MHPLCDILERGNRSVIPALTAARHLGALLILPACIRQDVLPHSVRETRNICLFELCEGLRTDAHQNYRYVSHSNRRQMDQAPPTSESNINAVVNSLVGFLDLETTRMLRASTREYRRAVTGAGSM